MKPMGIICGLACAVTLASCNAGTAPTTSVSNLEDPDSGFGDRLASSAAALDDVMYVADSRFARLRFTEQDATTGELALQGFFPQCLFAFEPSGQAHQLWVVGGDGEGVVTLRSFSDTNTDGVIDVGSAVDLLSGDRPDVTVGVAYDPMSGTMFLLEAGTGNVYRARDTNSDSRPDTLDPTPFIDGRWTGPGSTEPRVHEFIDPETSETILVPAGLSAYARSLVDPHPSRVTLPGIAAFEDTDADGVADAFAEYPVEQVVPPAVLTGRLVAGMTRVKVLGTGVASVELRQVDEQGMVIGTLGGTNLISGYGVITLSSGLTEDERVVLHDTTNNSTGDAHTVLPAAAYVEQPIGITGVHPGTAAELVFMGANLDLVTGVKLVARSIDGPEDLPLSYQVGQGSSQIQVQIPSLSESWVGSAEITFCVSDPEELFPVIVCDICPTGGGGSE